MQNLIKVHMAHLSWMQLKYYDNETNDYKRRRCENGKKQLNPVDNVGTIDTHPSKNTTKGGIAVAM